MLLADSLCRPDDLSGCSPMAFSLSPLQVELRRRIVRELLEVEEELKEENYATYVACEVYKFKQSEEAWTTRQEKKSKTRVSTLLLLPLLLSFSRPLLFGTLGLSVFSSRERD